MTSNGSDFFPQTARTFGQDNPGTVEQFRTGTGAPNSAPRNGPLVVNEVMYHPPDVSGLDNAVDEFIEVRNLTNAPVDISGWALQKAVNYVFPAGTTAAAGEHFLIVAFNPSNTSALAAFRAAYGVSDTVRIFGPYDEPMVNSTADVELAMPGTPIGGETPFFVVDHVVYKDSAPWPVGADGLGASLQRVSGTAFGNDPVNWIASRATPGLVNSSEVDSDGDGMPDAYEIANGFNPLDRADGAADADADGLTNAEECAAGTLPRDGTSALRVTVQAGPGGTMIVRFNALANRAYTVQFRDDLNGGPWQKLADEPAQATDRMVSVTDPAPGARRFYRVVTPMMP